MCAMLRRCSRVVGLALSNPRSPVLDVGRYFAPSFRHLCAASGSPKGDGHPAVTNSPSGESNTGNDIASAADSDGSLFAPNYSRRSRRERLQRALAAAAEGGEFEIPKAEPQAIPGPCGAVMNVLRKSGPLKTQELYDAVEAEYPGAVRSKTHLKQKILKSALVHKVLKVQLPDANVKNRWTLRPKGVERMKTARRLGK